LIHQREKIALAIGDFVSSKKVGAGTGFIVSRAIAVISNFACTIFGKVECTENGNMACT
jgi:hypothetical protein